MHVVTGILISNEIFRQQWFWYLGAFVAFNTLVFAGLTLGRVLPWPRPVDEITLDDWRHRLDLADERGDATRD